MALLIQNFSQKKSIMPVGKAYSVMPVLLLQVVRNAPKTSYKYLTFPDRDFVLRPFRRKFFY